MKVYIKRGNTNYKEKRLIKELTPVISDMADLDPTFMDKFEPARTYEQLDQMYNKYCQLDGPDTPKQPTPINAPTDNENKEVEKIENEDPAPAPAESSEVTPEPTSQNKPDKISDPLNRAEPLVRDYVLDDTNNQVYNKDATHFAEPVDFGDAFSLPDNNEDPTEDPQTKQPSQETPQQSDNDKFNPDVDSKKAKRKSQRFAKTVVQLVCDLSEKGYVFWTTNNISEAALSEYEANGEMDLSLLLEMPDSQQITVRQFFAMRCEQAKLEKISEEDREDLTDALAEVFLEKGIAPTPTQELLLLSAKVFGVMAIKGMQTTAETNAVLAQLREQKAQEQPYEPIEEETPAETPADTPTEDIEAQTEQTKVVDPDFQNYDAALDEQLND